MGVLAFDFGNKERSSSSVTVAENGYNHFQSLYHFASPLVLFCCAGGLSEGIFSQSPLVKWRTQIMSVAEEVHALRYVLRLMVKAELEKNRAETKTHVLVYGERAADLEQWEPRVRRGRVQRQTQMLQ